VKVERKRMGGYLSRGRPVGEWSFRDVLNKVVASDAVGRIPQGPSCWARSTNSNRGR